MKKLFAVIILMLAIAVTLAINGVSVANAEDLEGNAYAVVTEDGDCVFLRSLEGPIDGTITDIMGKEYIGSIYTVCETENEPVYLGPKTDIERVYVAEGSIIRPLSMWEWFYGCSSMQSFDGTGFDTSNVGSMSNMFAQCNSLTEINVSCFDTGSVTAMASMFSNCASLIELDLSSFDTSSVWYMNYMFEGCSSLIELDLSNFDTSGFVSYYQPMEGMFYNCSSLSRLDIRGFDTEKLSDNVMLNLFYGCTNLSEIVLGPKFTNWGKYGALPDLTDSNAMWTHGEVVRNSGDLKEDYPNHATDWAGVWEVTESYAVLTADRDLVLCRSREQYSSGSSGIVVDITGEEHTGKIYPILNENSLLYGNAYLDCNKNAYKKVYVADGSIISCKALEFIRESSNLVSFYGKGFDTSRSFSLDLLFYNCTSLTDIDLSGFDTCNATSMNYMFAGCTSLSSLDLRNINVSNVTQMYRMFSGCESLINLNLSGLDTSNVTDMSYMFSDCSSLSELDLNGLATENLTTMVGMFTGCGSLEELDLSSFNTENVTSIDGLFSKCSQLTEIELRSFDTRNVTSMGLLYDYDIDIYRGGVFEGCSSLKSLDLSSFDTSNVISMMSMFSGCGSLSELDLSSFDTSNVVNMRSMFSGCSSLDELDLSSFDTSRGPVLNNMFSGCSSLTELDLSGFDTSNITEMNNMFSGCYSLVKLDLSNFDTFVCSGFNNMFENCHYLSEVIISSLDNKWLSQLPGNDLWIHDGITKTKEELATEFDSHSSEWAGSWKRIRTYAVLADNGDFVFLNSTESIKNESETAVTDLSGSVFEGIVFTYLKDISEWDAYYQDDHFTSYCPWKDCISSIKRVYVSEGSIIRPVGTKGWFTNCSNLVSFDGTGFDTSNTTTMMVMFDGCTSLRQLNISMFNTKNVTDMFGMFRYCSSLSELDLRNFDTSNNTSTYYMFNGCSSLTYLDISSFDTNKVTSSYLMFGNCNSLVKIKLGAGFTRWSRDGSLPSGVKWTHGDLVKTSQELVDEYPSHAAEWAGVWTRQMDPVTFTTAKNYGSGILVEWDAVEGATGYVVYRRAMKSGSTEWTAFARWNNTTELSFLDTKAYEGTKYQYGIKAYYGNDPTTIKWLGPVGPMSTALVYSKKPAAPTKTSTVNTNSGIEISWDTVKGAMGYVIYRRAWSSTTNGWTDFQRWNNTTSTTWTDTKVYAGTRYQYGIKSYYGNDPKNMTYVGSVGPLSTNVRITTRTIRSIRCEYDWNTVNITVEYDGSSVFTGYQIQYSNDTEFSSKKTITVSDPKKTSCSFSFEQGGKVYVRVRSYHVFNGVTYYGGWSEVEQVWI